jgi:microcystin-dependent protein
MASPYIGEIRCFGFSFAPVGWAFCNGQLVPIAQNEALYAIIGTIYGGDGVTTFALPNLQGQAPMHWGNGPGGFNTAIGQVQGDTAVSLTATQMPVHAHTINCVTLQSGGVVVRTNTPDPTALIAPSEPDGVYQKAPTIDAPFSNQAISIAGASQPHDNMQPYLALNFCIALEGIFPSRN